MSPGPQANASVRRSRGHYARSVSLYTLLRERHHRPRPLRFSLLHAEVSLEVVGDEGVDDLQAKAARLGRGIEGRRQTVAVVLHHDAHGIAKVVELDLDVTAAAPFETVFYRIEQ